MRCESNGAIEPLVMEMQAGYRCDHYVFRVPIEDLEAAFAR
jgi:hypothetical protein